MRHARDDYQRIQDPAGLIPEDEPVFLIRGQDELAADVLEFYAEQAAKRGVDAGLIRRTLEQAKRMRVWPKHKKPDLARAPDGGTEGE
jgi:hypothetical protein